jgi:uncharacterized protein (DUF1800 family)
MPFLTPRRLAGIVAGCSLGLAAVPVQAQSPADSARALHLVSRATWGPRPTDVAEVLTIGADKWLDRQLQPRQIEDRDTEARLKLLPTISLSMSELYRDYSPNPADVKAAQKAQAMRDSGDAMSKADMMTPEQRRERAAKSPQRLHLELATAKLQRSVFSERQLEDVMTDFWFNHFNVFFGKGQDRYLVADYERNAIRPNVFGKFQDLLVATSQHPAMLFYLDNWQSVHVDSSARPAPGAGPARQRSRGLNENYARELLELHTLGVDGGYTQKDVVEVARALTGWSYEPPNVRQQQQGMDARAQARPLRALLAGRGRLGALGAAGAINGRGGWAGMQDVRGKGDVPFVFRAQMHDRGEKLVLGNRLPANRGIEDGMDVMRIVSHHPATARFIATKLVERFVSDMPPADLVDRLADVFTKTDGDLREVTRALFSSEEFYRAEYRHAKVKTPYELVVSAARATNAEVSVSRRSLELLRTMGHMPYSEPTPTGFPAMSEDWVNSGAMLNRMNFGLDLAGGRVDGIRVDPALIPRGESPKEAILAAVLPGIDTKRLSQRIGEDLAAEGGVTGRARQLRILGLALGSPEFQRR